MKVRVVVPVFPSMTVACGDDDDGLVVRDDPDAPGEADVRGGRRLPRLTEKYSSNSPIRSPLTATVMVLIVCPGAKVSVPEVAV